MEKINGQTYIESTEVLGKKTKYWCFICKKESIVSEKNKELVCNFCNSEFVEEIEEQEENVENGSNIDDPRNFVPVTVNNNSSQRSNHSNTHNPNIIINTLPQVTFQIISSANGQIQSRTFNSDNANNSQNFFPFQAILQQVNNLFNLGNSGNGNFVINTNNFGNNPLLNFLGRHNDDQQFENLLNYLMTNDPNRYGNPPASKKAVEELPREKIEEESFSKYKENDCLICMEGFEVSQIATKLNCSHTFHDKCILDWLKVHNTCPVCRYEMVTDDPDYESRKNERRRVLRNYNASGNVTNNSNTNNQNNSQG